MAPNTHHHHRRHAIQLISRILNTRPAASPFTLILDDLNQRAHPLVADLLRRALARNLNVVLVSFETTQFPPSVHSIPAWDNTPLLPRIRAALHPNAENLVIIDSLSDLSAKNTDITALFALVAAEFSSTLVGIYHTDSIPEPDPASAYAPLPLDLLRYTATTILTCRSLAHVLAAKRARERSLPEPTHGLLHAADGAVQCLLANDARGVVVDAEFRRKSGRGESETFFLRAPRRGDYNPPAPGAAFGTLRAETVVLLDQLPEWSAGVAATDPDTAGVDSTFSLGLTEKQKRAREGVVLPYFDAQRGEGAGEGGRILYDMGEEDDFDDEEDEI